jgi:hypothetical protein
VSDIDRIRQWRDDIAEANAVGPSPVEVEGWRDVDVLLQEIDRRDAILRKLVNEPAHEHRAMQWYVDLDQGVLDLHLDHLTRDEMAHLRSLSDQHPIDKERG